MSVKQLAIFGLVILMFCFQAGAQEADEKVDLSIPPAPLSEALRRLSEQKFFNFFFPLDEGFELVRTSGAKGSYTLTEALDALLTGTGVEYRFIAPDLVRFERAAPAEAHVRPRAVPVVRVESERLLEGGHLRALDNSLPYLAFGRDEIERFSSTSLADLLRRELPVIAANSRSRPDLITGLNDQINLRGLGSTQTQILIDGRRFPGRSLGGNSLQPDIESLPLSAIERIEVRQATGSAWYGAGAAGGVINIVRRHCGGSEMRLDFGDGYSAGAATRRAFLAHCASWNDERTQMLLTGSASEEGTLVAGDRSFLVDAREALQQNNPAFLVSQFAPPLGAQPNIRTLDGSGLWGPGTPSFTSLPAGYTAADGMEPLLANAGHYNLAPADTAQADGGNASVLRNGPSTRYFSWSLRHVTDMGISAFVDATLARSEISSPLNGADFSGLRGAVVLASAPNNPFGKNLVVTVPLVGADRDMESSLRSHRIVGGVSIELEGVAIGAEVARSESVLRWQRPLARNVAGEIATGMLDILRDPAEDPYGLGRYVHTLSVIPLVTKVDSATLSVSLPIFTGLRNPPRLSASIERRSEYFTGGSEQADDPELGPLSAPLNAERMNIVGTAVALRIPVGLSGQRDPPVEINLAGRADNYSTVSTPPQGAMNEGGFLVRTTEAEFSSTSTAIGIQYRPSSLFRLRASTTTGYLPPTAAQLADSAWRVFPFGALRDPKRGNEPTGNINFLYGGNPDLLPERSRSWSAGATASLAGLTLSIDRVRTDKIDGIYNPAEVALLELERFESLYPNNVARYAPGKDDPYSVGRIKYIDAASINSARASIVAWDAQVQYETWVEELGKLSFSALGTWQPILDTSMVGGAANYNQAGVSSDSPLKFAAAGNVTFSRGHWSVGWSTRYMSAYRVSADPLLILNQGTSQVPSQTYHDVMMRYRVKTAPASFEVQLNLQNVFNTSPPFDAGSASYVSEFGDPRLGMYSLSVVGRF